MDRILQKEKSCDGQPSSPELEQGSPVEDVSGSQRTHSHVERSTDRKYVETRFSNVTRMA